MNHQESARLCLIEDDAIMGESLIHRFALEGIDCDWYQDAGSALQALATKRYVAVISDIRLPDRSGEEFFQAMIDQGMTLPTIFITGYSSIEQAVRLLKWGATDYLAKPFDLEQLLDKLRSACPMLFMETPAPQPVLGISSIMRDVEHLLCRVSQHNANILITGQSGVGKEYAARYLHACADPGESQTFLALNCAAVQENLLESELFGHEKGAFTSAMRLHRGVFERAHGGTLLLDEVGEMSLAMQAKLLRAIQEQEIQRVGSEEAVSVSVRLICVTNRDLKAMVSDGSFREDLFYRINVINIHIPSLAERKEDIIWFARRFIEEFGTKYNVRRYLLPAGEQYLMQQAWPGNLRELHHVIERACILAEREILGPNELGAEASERPHDMSNSIELKSYLQQCERDHLLARLHAHDWQIQETANSLGISRKSLWEKMRKYEIASQKLANESLPPGHG